MPTTRSMKSALQDNLNEILNAVTQTDNGTPTDDSATNSGTTPTGDSAHTSDTQAGDTDGTVRTTKNTENTDNQQRGSKPPSAPRSTASRKKQRELAKAREELLRKEIELAALRVATLEAESEEEDEDIEENVTVKEKRTREWVQSNTLAIAMLPHAPDNATRTREPQAGDIEKAPPMQPAGDVTQPPPVDEAHGEQGNNLPARAKETATNPLPPARYVNREPTQREGIDYRELATAITLAARAVQPATAPRVTELPTFSGSSSEWLPFKVAFEESASQLTEQENLARLRRSLRGPARDASQCLFVGSTTSNEVMKLLATRFGRPDALVMAELNKLRALPRLAENPKDICIFASRVVNITATIIALNKKHYLHNTEAVRGVVEKLPAALRYRYYDFAAEQPEEQPDLITLSRFLELTADRCGSFAPAEAIPSEDRREPSNKKIARSYSTSEQKTTPSTTSKQPCSVCSRENHATPDCYTLKNADVPARWELAKKHKLCFRCLKYRKFKHVCKTKKCDINGCTQSHHPLLHSSSPPSPMEATAHAVEEIPAVTITSTKEEGKTAFLKILPVQVAGPKGVCNTYALLDDGSTCTLIEAAVAEQIGAIGPPSPFYIEGVAGARVNAYQSTRVNFTISGRRSQSYTISARTMEKLQLSPQSVPRSIIKSCRHLRDIEEQLIYEEGRPTILLGQDNWHLLLTHDVRRGDNNQPVASLTDLGWVLHGSGGARAQTHRVSHLTITEEEERSMEEIMKKHFALESLGVEAKRSYNDSEQRALRILDETTRRLPAGGFETGLIWRKDNPTPPDSYGTALRRLELIEKKLDKDEEIKKRYEEQINTLLRNGYAEIAPATKSERTWYLPHFAVINPQKPDKLRIVHDAAAKTKGTSLNDMLLPGPDLLQSLPGVLMRFRQRPVAVTADIKDMFLRVTIREEDRDMQRFLWRGDRREGEPTEYRMKSVIFGATSSPCTAIYVKNKNAEDHREKYPEAAAAIVNNHYVDDYLSSFDTEEEAIRVSSQVAHVHSRANYHLQRWSSNSRLVRAKFSADNTENLVRLDSTKILGMVWRPEEDTLSFSINEHKIPADILNGERTPTKRESLRTIMSLFDPLGVATPVTIQAKKILQETWRTGIDWDEELQPKEAETWKTWVQFMQQLPSLAIPRCYPGLSSACITELHTFVDASSEVYACAIYWRTADTNGKVNVTLIAAKGRVAPLSKLTSIPRLELQAAVLGCRLANTSMKQHDLKPARRFYWTDSRTVLAWLRTGPRAYKPFVAHRVAEIMEETKTNEWRWVPTKDNVADDATRDAPHNFTSSHRWFRGPDFLYEQEECWPREEKEDTINEDTGEERTHSARSTTARLSVALPDPARFSNWLRLMRTTARVLQFIDRLRAKTQQCTAAYKRNKKNKEADPAWTSKKNKEKQKKSKIEKQCPRVGFIPIETHYMNRARELWLRSMQEEAFAEEIVAMKQGKPVPSTSRMTQLSVIMDSDGIIRLRSRIAAAADLTTEQREPPIVDGQHLWVRLYIAWVHRKLHHGGFETTANEVRQHMWVLRLRHAVRTELKRCQFCRIRRATPAQPSTGNHPRSRLAHHQRPFTFTGLDFFGPMTVTVGRTHQKRYGVIFTCLTTRAVHLEIASSLSTDSAVMALRRFIGRRGCPTELWSDQGTNFKGADLEMRKAAEEAMEEESSVHFINWRFIPPSAPFMGGAWERLVRSVKTALDVTLRERAPKEEVLATLLVEAEHTINSRPLTHVSTSADDEGALTPNHFILGGPSRVPQPGSFNEGDTAGRKEWRASQRLADSFWARWVKEYLPELQCRREPRATRGAIKLHDLVLIADGTLPRNSWPRGVVIATYPGPDGEIRAVDVRTSKGVLRRPTKKLVILPTTPPSIANTKETPATRAAAGEYVRDNSLL